MRYLKTTLSMIVLLVVSHVAKGQLDTMIVGRTNCDYQKPGSVGRTIDYIRFDNLYDNYGSCHEPEFITWIDQDIAGRYVYFSAIDFDDSIQEYTGGLCITPESSVDYATCASYLLDQNHNRLLDIIFACGLQNENTIVGLEWFIFPGNFMHEDIDNIGINIIGSPHLAIDESGIIHVVAHQMNIDSTDAKGLFYMKCEFNELQYMEPNDGFSEITGSGLNLSADIAVTEDGSRVAIAAVVHRDAILYGQQHALDNFNGDVVVWISEDGGETWDWDNPINITSFQGPENGEDRDTLRAYNDVNLLFDANDNLHVAFVVHGFHTTPQRYATPTSMIYHWDEASNLVALAADGRSFASGMDLGAGMRTVQRPTMTYDESMSTLYIVFQRAADPLFPQDCSDDNYANSEILITASPPYPEPGLLWSAPVNITNTRHFGGQGAIAGECQSERDPCVAIRNVDEYLHFTYLLDLDAGTANAEEGAVTNNPVVFQRYSKTELQSEFQTIQTWVPNVPLHHDSSDFWYDILDYSWDDHGSSFYVNQYPSPNGFTISPLLLQFENCIPGIVYVDTLLLQNSSADTIDILGYRFESGGNRFITELQIGTRIPPGSEANAVIRFRPDRFGGYFDKLILQTSCQLFSEARANLYCEMSSPPRAQALTGTLNDTTGLVYLNWEYEPAEVSDSIIYSINRNYESIGMSRTTSFVDTLTELPADEYMYNVIAHFRNQPAPRSNTISVNWEGLGIQDGADEQLPTEWAVSALYPNPFNPTIHAEIAVPSSEHVQVKVFDILGRTVATLVNRKMEAGYHTLHWTAEGPSGVYFLVTENSSGWREVNRVVFLK